MSRIKDYTDLPSLNADTRIPVDSDSTGTRSIRGDNLLPDATVLDDQMSAPVLGVGPAWQTILTVTVPRNGVWLVSIDLTIAWSTPGGNPTLDFDIRLTANGTTVAERGYTETSRNIDWQDAMIFVWGQQITGFTPPITLNLDVASAGDGTVDINEGFLNLTGPIKTLPS